jgi:CMP-N,N'-diacetyllegionaminic acid synthase
MAVLVVIPARGGSKGLPGKNLRTVGGVSLVGHAVRVGRGFVRRAGLEGAIVLVDTDSAEIAAEGLRWGAQVPFLRPAHLAEDTTATIDNVLHAAERVEREIAPVDAIVLLQPTSPLRSIEDVCACWGAYEPSQAPSVVSVAGSAHPPELSVRLDASGTLQWAFGGITGSPRRQDFTPSHRPNGAVYVDSLDFLRHERVFVLAGRTVGVEMPLERSVGVDSVEDLAEAEAALRRVPRPAIVGRLARHGRPAVMVHLAGGVRDVGPLLDLLVDAGVDAVRLARAQATAELTRTDAARGLVPVVEARNEAEAQAAAAAGARALLAPASALLDGAAVLAGSGLPLLCEGGDLRLAELVQSVDALVAAGEAPWGVLLDSSATGSAAESLQLLAGLRAVLGMPIGWSAAADRDSAAAAAALGADLVELVVADGEEVVGLARRVAALRRLAAPQ